MRHPFDQAGAFGNYQRFTSMDRRRATRTALATALAAALVGPMGYAGDVSLHCEHIEEHLKPGTIAPSERPYRGAPVHELKYGGPLPGLLKVPKRYGVRVARLLRATRRDGFPYKHYLRYMVTGWTWRSALHSAESILDGTYKWDRDGFSMDDEGNDIGPDELVMDPFHWVLLDRHGNPTLDRRQAWGGWYEDGSDPDPEYARIRAERGE